jgi:hypothetical protein
MQALVKNSMMNKHMNVQNHALYNLKFEKVQFITKLLMMTLKSQLSIHANFDC